MVNVIKLKTQPFYNSYFSIEGTYSKHIDNDRQPIMVNTYKLKKCPIKLT